jgi:hypothetical protein
VTPQPPIGPQYGRWDLSPDPLTVEPEPLDERIPVHPKRYQVVAGSRRRGCSVIPFLLLAVLVGSSIATPRSAIVPTAPSPGSIDVRPGSARPSTPTAGASGGSLIGAPHDHGGLHPGNGTQDGLASADRLFVPPTTVGAPQPTPALISEPPDRPYQSAIGTALFQASATWCGPNPRTGQCLRWGGHALLAALPTYTGTPYVVRVWRGARHVDVTVVSVCGCGIDLSPWAFQRLAPLSRGRIDVEVEGPIEQRPLPQTSSGGAR